MKRQLAPTDFNKAVLAQDTFTRFVEDAELVAKIINSQDAGHVPLALTQKSPEQMRRFYDHEAKHRRTRTEILDYMNRVVDRYIAQHGEAGVRHIAEGRRKAGVDLRKRKDV